MDQIEEFTFLCCVVPTPDTIGPEGYFSAGFYLRGNKSMEKKLMEDIGTTVVRFSILTLTCVTISTSYFLISNTAFNNKRGKTSNVVWECQ